MKLLIRINFFLAFVFILNSLVHENSYAASGSATATVTVIQALAIAKTQDLGFGVGAPGDGTKTVLPADSTAAIFNVTGQPNQPYTITLPTSLNMVRTGGTEIIVVNTFTSNPSATGTLNGSGAQTLRVGATRASIPLGQILGTYTGTFTVDVTY